MLYAVGALVIASVVNFCVGQQSPVDIGIIKPIAHGVKSGSVKILDDKTIRIQDFYYDGKGPDAWFVVGKDDKYKEERPKGGLPFDYIVPDENGSCEKPKGYTGKTIELTLPGNVTVGDIKYLAMYCIQYNHNFGYVTIPSSIRVPASKFDGPTKSCPRSGGTKAGGSVGYISLWLTVMSMLAIMLR